MKNFFTLFLFIVGAPAMAGPALFNTCNVHIDPVPGGAGVYMSPDCQTAYVLPPLNGKIEVGGLVPSLNLERCSIVSSYLNVMKNQAAKLEELSKRLDPPPTPPSTGDDDGSDLFPKNPAPGTNVGQGSDEDLEKQILDNKKMFADINDTLKDYWSMLGATGNAVFMADQQELVAAYQAKNPKINFTAMPIAAAKLYFLRKSSENTASLPAVLSFDIPGGKSPLGIYPASDTPQADEGLIFGGSLAGHIELSLMGACPFYNSATSKMRTDKISASELSQYFVANVNYAYDLAVNRSYEASYNLASFLRRVQTSESKGGFFSSKTINKLIVEKDSKDWFKFTAKNEDGRYDFDNQLEQTVKAELIDRVFKQINLLSVGSPEQPPALSAPKADGAQTAADGLHKCPYIYCQVGAFILDVGNAIFGSSQAVSEFIQNNDFWAKDSDDETKALPFQGTVSFGGVE